MTFPQFLVIEGNIGAGKTSLAQMISDKYGAGLVLEQFADNPFLPKFYEDNERYAFQLELSFMADRYRQLQAKLLSTELFEPFRIADYFFMKSLIFAGITLHDDEYKLYRQLFDIIYKTLPKPDLYVYLNLPVDRLLENIKKRNRSYESGITAAYLKKLKIAYWDFFKQCGFPVLILNTEQVDFVNNENHFEIMEDLILNKEYKPGITIKNVEPFKISDI